MKRFDISINNRGRISIILLIALLFVFGTVLTALANGTWNSTGDTTYGRAEHQAVQLNDGRVLVTGGRLFSTASYKAEIYDPASGDWSETGPMNFIYTKHSTTLLADGRVLVAGSEGGFYSADSAAAEIYDPATNTWTATGFMTQGRSGHLAVRLNDGRVLVAGNQWGSTTAEIYDPATGVWTATGSMNTHHGRATASLLPDGRVLVAGGYYLDFIQGELVFDETEIYDPATGTWQYTGSLNVARQLHTVTTLADGRILVAAGRNQNNAWLDSAEVYDPATGTWSLTGAMNRSRYAHTATLLANGQVLVAGVPNVPNVNLLSVEIYDPANNVWFTATDAPEERWSHTATLLNNGDVLIAGGLQTSDASIGFDKVTAVLYTHDGGTPPPPPPAEPTDTHIGDLDGTSFWVNSRRWKTTVTIAVLDDLGSPVANAAVTGNWSGGISGSASCSTDGSGLCSITSSNIRKNKSSVTFTISNINHATLAYDPAANSDPDGDSNGTAITVLKP